MYCADMTVAKGFMQFSQIQSQDNLTGVIRIERKFLGSPNSLGTIGPLDFRIPLLVIFL